MKITGTVSGKNNKKELQGDDHILSFFPSLINVNIFFKILIKKARASACRLKL